METLDITELGNVPTGSATVADAGLRDRSEIADLLNRLYAAVDEHRFDDLRALLVDDVSAVTPGGTATGIEAVLAQVVRNHEGIAYLQHVASNLIIDVADDRASVRANLLVVFADAASRPECVFGTVSRFRVRRGAPRWRIEGIHVGTPTWRVDPAAASPA